MTLGGAAQDTRPTSRPAPSDAEIAAAIGDLDAESFARREAATAVLLNAGEAARMRLREAAESDSLERSTRAQNILAQIGVRAESRRAHADATLVTFQAESRPLSEVAAKLASEARYPVRVSAGGSGDRPVSVTWRDTPFFEALDQLARAAGLGVNRDPRDNTFILEPAVEKPPPTAYAGPVRVSLTMMSVTRQIRFGGQAFVSATLQLRVDAEDRVDTLGMLSPLTPAEITDDRDRSLMLAGQQASQSTYVVRSDSRRQIQTFIQMQSPEPDAKAIKKLRFNVPLILPEELFEAKLTELTPSPNPAASQGNFRVWIEDWTETAEKRSVRISLDRPAADGPLPQAYPLYDDVITFLSPDGTVIHPRTSQTALGGRKYTLTAELPVGPVGSVNVTSLKRARVLDLMCTFENVPLP